MSAEWPVVTLKEAGISLIDCDHKTPKEQQTGLPYVGIPQLKNGRIFLDGARLISEDDFHHWRRKAKPTPDDVILSRRCNPGEMAYVPENLNIALGQNLVLLRSDGKQVFPAYLRWITQGDNWWHQVNKYINVGAIFDSLRCADIPKFEFKLPPIDVQKNIAKVLGVLDAKIELNRQINQTLESMAQAIFQSWFVDFDPVKAKITAREQWQTLSDGERREWLNEMLNKQAYLKTCLSELSANNEQSASETLYLNIAAMTAISSCDETSLADMPVEEFAQLYKTASLFPERLVESELGGIPEGWEVLSLDYIANYQNGLALQKFRPEPGAESLPVVKIAQLKKGFSDTEEKASININPKCIIDNGDVVFSWSGSLMVDVWCGGMAALNQHLFKVTSNHYPKWFYYQWTKHHLAEFQRIAEAKAVTMGHIKREHLKSAYCFSPSSDVLSLIGSGLANTLEKQISSRLEAQSLELLRDNILPKLLSGELDVSSLTELSDIEQAVMDV